MSAVPALLQRAKELGVNVVGISFHVGSGCYDPSVYTDALSRARTAFDMGSAAGFTFDLLDLGGGFESASFEHAARVIRAGLERYFPAREREGVRVIAEPGRYYVATAFKLAACVIARRAPSSSPPSCAASFPAVPTPARDPMASTMVKPAVAPVVPSAPAPAPSSSPPAGVGGTVAKALRMAAGALTRRAPATAKDGKVALGVKESKAEKEKEGKEGKEEDAPEVMCTSFPSPFFFATTRARC